MLLRPSLRVRPVSARDLLRPTYARFGSTKAGIQKPFFSNEPEGPILKTDIPGPKSSAKISELSPVFDTRSLNMMAHYPSSVGNYLADPDGNVLLDMFAQIASIPVGYNNPRLRKAAQSEEMVSSLINRPALGNFPQDDWAEILKTGILRAAPKGMTQVFTSQTGSDANELAYKAAFMWKRLRQRKREHPELKSTEFTQEELTSTMENKAPGSPHLSIMSFRSGFHGRLLGSLSTTRSKPIHKIDIPAFDWPCAPFPVLKYPLHENEAANKAEEERCLSQTAEIIDTFPATVAAAIIEPIQSEGGDNHASAEYFRKLRQLLRKKEVLMIVDEVQTGMGSTGRLWAHEHWGLSAEDAPDMVTFSKKAQTAGYYFKDDELRANLPYRQFNTWMGDPARAILFRAIFDEIESKKLVQHTADVGDYLFAEMEKLSHKYPGSINNLRGKGQGTYIAFDSPKRDMLLKEAKKLGVNIGGCGEQAVRLRPMLVFQQRHADIFLDKLEKLLRSS